MATVDVKGLICEITFRLPQCMWS